MTTHHRDTTPETPAATQGDATPEGAAIPETLEMEMGAIFAPYFRNGERRGLSRVFDVSPHYGNEAERDKIREEVCRRWNGWGAQAAEIARLTAKLDACILVKDRAFACATKTMTEQERNEVKMNAIMKFIVDVRHQAAVTLRRIIFPTIGALFTAWASHKDMALAAFFCFISLHIVSEISGMTNSINELAKEMKAIREQRNETPND